MGGNIYNDNISTNSDQPMSMNHGAHEILDVHEVLSAAIGGGSVIDSAKCIGYGLAYDGDVWDIEGNIVTLISAANPEDYYHPDAINGAYISEYILTGNKNSNWSETNPESNYTKRNWDMYVNSSQGATSAEVAERSLFSIPQDAFVAPRNVSGL